MKAIRLEVDKKEKMVQFWANKVFWRTLKGRS
jgi:hypothetical protein